MTPYQKLVADWKDCRKCPLHETRKQVVMLRGSVPAPVLFVGEAPGDSEDSLGRPFCGPAGLHLNRQIQTALSDCGLEDSPPKMAFANLVGCIPKDKNTNRKRGEPLPAEIVACAPRLDSLIKLVKTRLIFATGELAARQAKQQKWEESYKTRVVHIMHPAAILRMDISQKGLVNQRVIVQISDAIADLCSTPQ